MVTVLVTSIFLLAVILVSIYLWQRVTPNESSNQQLPPSTDFKGLFADSIASEQSRLDSAEAVKKLNEKRRELLERAAAGDKETLPESHQTGDEQLYIDVLDTLVRRAENENQVLALASYIARNSLGLTINKTLAEAFTIIWKRAPNKRTTSEMLHLVAKAGDAAYYQQVIELVLQNWREQRLQDMTSDELVTLIESEFWLIPSSARDTGAGFLLKRELARTRRELLETRST